MACRRFGAKHILDNVGTFLIETIRTNFTEILIKYKYFAPNIFEYYLQNGDDFVVSASLRY